MWCIHKEFSYESIGEIILNIGPHLPKLLTNIKELIFGTQYIRWSRPSGAVYNIISVVKQRQRSLGIPVPMLLETAASQQLVSVLS